MKLRQNSGPKTASQRERQQIPLGTFSAIVGLRTAIISGLARYPRDQIDHLSVTRPVIRSVERFAQSVELLVRDAVQSHLQIQLCNREHMGRAVEPELAEDLNMILNGGEDCLQAFGHVLCHCKDPAAGAGNRLPRWRMMFRLAQ